MRIVALVQSVFGFANDAAEVRGMDVIPEAIADARKMQSVTDLQIRNMKQVKLNNGYRNG